MTSADVGAAGVKGYNTVKKFGEDVKGGNVFAAGKDLYDIHELAGQVDKFASGHSGEIMGDPLAALIEAGLDFLLDLISPLKEALNLVTGDPEGLKGKAEEWAGVAESLRQLGPAAVQDARSTEGKWTGAAADAFRTKITNFERGVLSVAGQADHVADVLRISATLMDAAQGIIKGIIASWVEYAILTEAAAAAASVFTFGASEAAGQAAVAGEAAVACGRGAEVTGEAASMLERAAAAIRQVEGAFSQSAHALEESAQSMRAAESAFRGAAQRAAAENLTQAGKVLDKGVEEAVRNAGIDAGLGLGDDLVHTAGAQSQDGHESQQQVDSDLTFGT